MVVLAQLPADRALRAPELAHATGIPVHYLSKVMRRLVLAEMVESQRGHGGGFRLRRSARGRTLASILRAVDALPDGEGCLFGLPRCDDARPCPLHDVWSALRRQVQKWAESTRLNDVVPPSDA